MKNNYIESFVVFASLLVVVTCLFPEISFAGTGGEELKSLYDKTVEVAQGYGGKSVAAIAFLLALVATIKGNLMACGSAFGVGIIAGIGPQMVTSGISAII